MDTSSRQAARDRVALDALPGLTAGLAGLQALLALVHATLGSPAERPLIVVDLLSAALALGLRLALGRGALPERAAHPFVVGCGAVATSIVLLHLLVLGDALQGLMLALVVIGAGSILLSFRWLALLAGGTLLGWLSVMSSLGWPPGSLRVGITLLSSWGLAAMILSARLRSFVRLEELRAANEARLTLDVAEARSLAAAMRQSEEAQRLLFERSPLPMWLVERRTLRFLAVNDAALRLYGYVRSEFLELTLKDVRPPEDVPQLLADLAPDSEGIPLVRRHRTQGGTLIDVEVVAHHISFAESQALLAVMTDVTERHRAAQERELLIAELTQALANVKTLRGLIPICATCKKIRDDKGYWNQVEVYVRERSEARFSHGICPDCVGAFHGR